MKSWRRRGRETGRRGKGRERGRARRKKKMITVIETSILRPYLLAVFNK